MKKTVLLIIVSIFILLADTIELFPYQEGAVDTLDENYDAGKLISRIALESGQILSSDDIGLSNSTDFTTVVDSVGSIWLASGRLFDYENGDRSFPLTITVNSLSLTMDTVITIRPKNDNAFEVEWARHHIITEDTVVAFDLEAFFTVTDADLPADANSWSIIRIVQEPSKGEFSYDPVTHAVRYDPSQSGVEFDVNTPDTMIVELEDRASYDSTRALTWATVFFYIKNTNDEPVGAFNDTLAVTEGESVTETVTSASSILDNDTDHDNDVDRNGDGIPDVTFPLSASLISESNSEKGILTLNSNGSFSYHHVQGGGSDIFFYEVTDGISTDTARIVVNITLENDNAPELAFDTLYVDQGAEIDSFLTGEMSLLAFASDADLPDDSILIFPDSSATTAGSVVINADGTFLYVHSGERLFSDSFEVVVVDNAGHRTSETVYVVIKPAPVKKLSAEVIPLNGIMPDRYIFPDEMVNDCAIKPAYSKGTAADILFSRTVAPGDLALSFEILDVVGNKVIENSYPENNQADLLITRTGEDNRVRVFWSAVNDLGRKVGAGTYLCKLSVTDKYSGEKIELTTMWSLKDDLYLPALKK